MSRLCQADQWVRDLLHEGFESDEHEPEGGRRQGSGEPDDVGTTASHKRDVSEKREYHETRPQGEIVCELVGNGAVVPASRIRVGTAAELSMPNDFFRDPRSATRSPTSGPVPSLSPILATVPAKMCAAQKTRTVTATLMRTNSEASDLLDVTAISQLTVIVPLTAISVPNPGRSARCMRRMW